MLKPLVLKFRSDLSVLLRDIVEKQVPAKLKPIVGVRGTGELGRRDQECRCRRLLGQPRARHDGFAKYPDTPRFHCILT